MNKENYFCSKQHSDAAFNLGSAAMLNEIKKILTKKAIARGR